MLDELFDSVAEAISDFFSSLSDSLPDALSGVDFSSADISAIADGDFDAGGVDYSQLFDNGGQISFGNSYDDRTAKVLAQIKDLGVDIPINVNQAPIGSSDIAVERHPNGGMLSIDKSLIVNSLKKAADKGIITQAQLENLRNQISGC